MFFSWFTFIFLRHLTLTLSAFINVTADIGERKIDYLISKNLGKTMNQEQNEPYWTPLEREVFYEEVSKRIEVIDGKLKGANSGKAEKNRAWLEITDVVNA